MTKQSTELGLNFPLKLTWYLENMQPDQMGEHKQANAKISRQAIKLIYHFSTELISFVRQQVQ